MELASKTQSMGGLRVRNGLSIASAVTPRLETHRELGCLPMEGVTGCFSSKGTGVGTVPMSQAWGPHSPQTQPGVEPQHS